MIRHVDNLIRVRIPWRQSLSVSDMSCITVNNWEVMQQNLKQVCCGRCANQSKFSFHMSKMSFWNDTWIVYKIVNLPPPPTPHKNMENNQNIRNSTSTYHIRQEKYQNGLMLYIFTWITSFITPRVTYYEGPHFT